MIVSFTALGWEQYTSWTDRAILRRINALISDIRRHEHAGIGKPEPLRHNLAGWWSRRIDQEHRLVYRIVDDGKRMEIASCRLHYQNGLAER